MLKIKHSYLALLRSKKVWVKKHHANVFKICHKSITHRSYRDVLTKKGVVCMKYDAVTKILVFEQISDSD